MFSYEETTTYFKDPTESPIVPKDFDIIKTDKENFICLDNEIYKLQFVKKTNGKTYDKFDEDISVYRRGMKIFETDKEKKRLRELKQQLIDRIVEINKKLAE